MYNILYTLLAEDDLLNLFETIAEDKPSAAIEYITKLEKHIELLQDNPQLGLKCKNKNINKDCRILVYEGNLIFYTFNNDEILIIRILNSRINYKEKI